MGHWIWKWSSEKKFKSDYAVPSHCDEFFSPILNEKIKKNKNVINSNYKCDSRWVDIGSLILNAAASVINIASIYLDEGNKNRMKESKEIIVKVIDTITLLRRASQ